MERIKFVHCADLHLDTPFKGLTQTNHDLAQRLKDATLKSFRRIIDLCITENVDFLLIAGDIFDSSLKSLAAQLFFINELKRLSLANIHTYIITGNHDPLVSWIRELEMPEKVTRFGSKEVECIQHFRNSNLVADIYGISYENASVEWNLAEKFTRQPSGAPFAFALMHGTISTARAGNNYAPFTLDDIRNKGFDYWALGHVHKRQVAHPAFPTVVYPGNPQGRDFGETGVRGCYLVEIEGGNAPVLTFVPVQQLRFEVYVIDMTGIETINILSEKIQATLMDGENAVSDESLMARIILTGRTSLHGILNKPGETGQLTDLLNNMQTGQRQFFWIDSIQIQTTPDVNEHELKLGNTFIAELLKYYDTIMADDKNIDAILNETEPLFTQAFARRELEELQPAEKSEILNKAKWMLVNQFTNE